jgi:hypothetical protein
MQVGPVSIAGRYSYGGNEIRAYFDLDDRQAAEIVGLPATAARVAPSATAQVNPVPRRRIKR